MKPKDILAFLKVCLSGAGAVAVFIFFQTHKTPPGPGHDFVEELILKVVFSIFLLIAIFYMAILAKKIGKADGLAFGYFYNFIYETVIFIKGGGIVQETGKTKGEIVEY